MTTSKQEEIIFTRVRGLASVVWDPEKDRMLAHFNKQGLLKTGDPRIIKRLISMGYRPVSAEQVTEAGLMVPSVEEGTKTPGRGYTHDGEGRPSTAHPLPGQDATVHNAHGMFDPVDEDFPSAPAHGTGRSLVK